MNPLEYRGRVKWRPKRVRTPFESMDTLKGATARQRKDSFDRETREEIDQIVKDTLEVDEMFKEVDTMIDNQLKDMLICFDPEKYPSLARAVSMFDATPMELSLIHI